MSYFPEMGDLSALSWFASGADHYLIECSQVLPLVQPEHPGLWSCILCNGHNLLQPLGDISQPGIEVIRTPDVMPLPSAIFGVRCETCDMWGESEGWDVKVWLWHHWHLWASCGKLSLGCGNCSVVDRTHRRADVTIWTPSLFASPLQLSNQTSQEVRGLWLSIFVTI